MSLANQGTDRSLVSVHSVNVTWGGTEFGGAPGTQYTKVFNLSADQVKTATGNSTSTNLDRVHHIEIQQLTQLPGPATAIGQVAVLGHTPNGTSEFTLARPNGDVTPANTTYRLRFFVPKNETNTVF